MNTKIATFFCLMLLVPVITVSQEALTPAKVTQIVHSYKKFQGLPIQFQEIKDFPISEEICIKIENNIILFKKLLTTNTNVKSDDQSNIEFHLIEFKKDLHLFFSEKFSALHKDKSMTLKEKKYHQTLLSISFLVAFHEVKDLSDRLNPFTSKL